MLNETIVSEIATKLGMPEVLEQFRSAETPADGVNPFADKITGIHVFGQTQLDERLANERAAAAEEARKAAVGNTYGAMDKRILTETGIAKNEGESTVEYMTRASKAKFGNKGDESADMQRLRTDLEDAKKALLEKSTEFDQLTIKHASESKSLQINSKLDAAINSLALDAPADKLDSQRRFLKYELEQKYTVDVVEGRVEFTDKATGKVVKNPTTQSPLTEAEVIAQFAPTVVSLKSDSSAKPGSGYKGSSNNLNEGQATGFDFSQYSTKDDFAKDLNKQGISSGSARGTELYEAFLKARPDLK